MNLPFFYKLSMLFFVLISFSQYTYAIDTSAGKKKAAPCSHCHGNNGNSKNPQFPSLAGQRALYLENQLNAFQSESRVNSVMQNIVSKLSPQDIKDIAAYFASLSIEKASNSLPAENKGKEKFSRCAGCHGASAEGRGATPKLAGQQQAYLEKQLLSFKDKTRKGGPMNVIANGLTEDEIKEISTYLSSLP